MLNEINQDENIIDYFERISKWGAFCIVAITVLDIYLTKTPKSTNTWVQWSPTLIKVLLSYFVLHLINKACKQIIYDPLKEKEHSIQSNNSFISISAIADIPYYSGFVLTLVIIACSIFQFSILNSLSSQFAPVKLIVDFGIGMLVTGLAIINRQALVARTDIQILDPDDWQNKINRHTQKILNTISDAQEKIEETTLSTNDQIRRSQEGVAVVNDELFKAFTKASQNNTEMLVALIKNAEERITNNLVSSFDQVQSQINAFTNETSSIQAKLSTSAQNLVGAFVKAENKISAEIEKIDLASPFQSLAESIDQIDPPLQAIMSKLNGINITLNETGELYGSHKVVASELLAGISSSLSQINDAQLHTTTSLYALKSDLDVLTRSVSNLTSSIDSTSLSAGSFNSVIENLATEVHTMVKKISTSSEALQDQTSLTQTSLNNLSISLESLSLKSADSASRLYALNEEYKSFEETLAEGKSLLKDENTELVRIITNSKTQVDSVVSASQQTVRSYEALHRELFDNTNRLAGLLKELLRNIENAQRNQK